MESLVFILVKVLVFENIGQQLDEHAEQIVWNILTQYRVAATLSRAISLNLDVSLEVHKTSTKMPPRIILGRKFTTKIIFSHCLTPHNIF
jgi:hypothetical protein